MSLASRIERALASTAQCAGLAAVAAAACMALPATVELPATLRADLTCIALAVYSLALSLVMLCFLVYIAMLLVVGAINVYRRFVLSEFDVLVSLVTASPADWQTIKNRLTC
jgi:hypothetical protein